jgi:hypothetical protein
MQRRNFIAGLGAAAWPNVARSQQRPLPTIGWLHTGNIGRVNNAFYQELAEVGYAEGRNVATGRKVMRNAAQRSQPT